MPRGDIVTIADRGGEFTGKPRTAVVIQGNSFGQIASVTICPMTSTEVDAPLLRLEVRPSPALPIARTSWIQVDKITTVRRERVSAAIGRLSTSDVVRLNAALAVVLGLG